MEGIYTLLEILLLFSFRFTICVLKLLLREIFEESSANHVARSITWRTLVFFLPIYRRFLTKKNLPRVVRMEINQQNNNLDSGKEKNRALATRGHLSRTTLGLVHRVS